MDDGDDKQVGVPTGGQYQYRLRYASEPGTTVKNMVLFDGLEAYEYIRDKTAADDSDPNASTGDPKSDEIDIDRNGYEVVTWQGTFESIDVSKIEAMGAKADLYYTTKDRQALAVDDQSDGSGTLADRDDPADSVLADCWEGPFTAAELNDLDDETKASITGLAIDMRKKTNGSDFELDSNKSVAAIVTMRAPSDPTTVRDLVNKAEEQYENAADEDKKITNDKPYTYNAVNMNSSVKQKGTGTYSEAHLITYEYTRAYLYVPHGNISIAKRVTGMTDEEASTHSFKVKATVEQPDGSTESFAGKYNRIDTSTGYYYTDDTAVAPYADDEGTYHAEGVFVSMSDTEFGPYYVTYSTDDEAWVNCDADGNPTGDTKEAADADSYTFETEEGQEEFTIRGNQRIVLIDCEADLNWTVTEVAESADGFRTSHTLNGADGEDDYTTAPFVIGDKNTARIVYTNMSTSELVVQKKVAIGDEDKKFSFTIKITDKSGNEYLDWEGNPQVFDYVGEADEGVVAPANGTLRSGDTIQLMHGQRIRIFVPGGTKYSVVETVLENYEDPAIEKKYDTLITEEDGEETTTRYETETSESDGTGTIKASGDSATETFTNTHVPDEQPKKEVEGNDVVVGEIENDEESENTGDSTNGESSESDAESTEGTENAEGSGTENASKADGADTTNEEHTHVDLGAYANPFTYTITQKVPIETKQMVLTDTLEDVLEFVSTASDVVVLDANGKPVADNTDLKVDISIEGQTLTVTIAYADPEITDEEGNVVGVKNELDKLVGGQVSFAFVAKIRDGADLAPYASTGSILVPNTAKVQFNNRPAVETNTVTVTPPPPDEKIAKRVMDKEHYDLTALQEEYSYAIDVLVPVDATKVVVTDTLEPVLNFVGGEKDVKVLYGAQAIEGAKVEIKGKTLTVTLVEDAAIAQRTRLLTIRFTAMVDSAADLSPYITNGKAVVPNTASYQVNDDSSRRFQTPPVTVTPPPDGSDNPPGTTPGGGPDDTPGKGKTPAPVRVVKNALAKTGDEVAPVALLALAALAAAAACATARRARR